MTTDEKLAIYFKMENEGYNTKDISERLGMNEKALRNLLRRKNYTCINGKYIPKDNDTKMPTIDNVDIPEPPVAETIKPIIKPKKNIEPKEAHADTIGIKEELTIIKNMLLDIKGSNEVCNEIAISIDNPILGNEMKIKELKHFSIRADKDILNSFHELCNEYPNINKSYIFTLALKEFIENHK